MLPSLTFPSRISSISVMSRPASPGSSPILSHSNTFSSTASAVSKEYPRYCKNNLFSNLSSNFIYIASSKFCSLNNHLVRKDRKNLVTGSAFDVSWLKLSSIPVTLSMPLVSREYLCSSRHSCRYNLSSITYHYIHSEVSKFTNDFERKLWTFPLITWCQISKAGIPIEQNWSAGDLRVSFAPRWVLVDGKSADHQPAEHSSGIVPPMSRAFSLRVKISRPGVRANSLVGRYPVGCLPASARQPVGHHPEIWV